MMYDKNVSRRNFIGHCCSGLAVWSLTSLGIASCGDRTKGNESSQGLKGNKSEGKLGIALVGLGKYSTDELAPALKETSHCELRGIVTGSPEKADKWKRKYDIRPTSVYNYESFDSIRDNADIDIVYVVLPNAMHKEYVIRAAQAGKHVICEKPMAISVEECDAMIDACKSAGKMLSIGYRLHFDPYHQEVMRLGQDKVMGQINKISAEDGQKDIEGWRLNRELAGGGPLVDLGIYCIQGVRYTTGKEPIAVIAQEGQKKDPKKFASIEESLTWQMEMPDGIVADCKASYAEDMNKLRAETKEGFFELSPAYEYKGIDGKTSKGVMRFKQTNQQAAQMDDFAMSIKTNHPSRVPGEMGRQDVKIIQAIYESMRTRQRVVIT
jgi:predicted dehydrogenase